MSKPKPTIKDARLIELLERSGQQWRVEAGGKHIKLYVGTRMVGVMPYNGGTDRSRRDDNLLHSVKRHLRDIGALK